MSSEKPINAATSLCGRSKFKSFSESKMKRTFQILALFSTLCAALPSAPQQTITFACGGKSSLGAAYFMNNDPSGNYLFAASIERDARLVLRKAYYTGGTGIHGVGPTTDALFSQGSIIRSYVNNIVILTNPGSNTLSLFRIDPENPTNLEMIGDPVPSGGDFPISVAMNNAEDVVCALNSGKVNNVNCFTLDGLTGLAPFPNTTRSLGLQQAIPPTGPAGTGSQLAFTPDGRQLVLTIKGLIPAPGYLAIWNVERDGSLSERFQTMYGGLATWTITFINGRNALLSADPLLGYVIFDLDAFAANSSAQGTEYRMADQGAVCWSDWSPQTNNYYLSDFLHSTIYEVEVDVYLNTRVVNRYPVEQYDGTLEISVASLPGRPDHLYVLASNHTSLEVFTLNGPGRAERIQKMNIKRQADRAGVPFGHVNAYGMITWVKSHEL
ncbi:hypothetical protein AX17_003208 [Amanita inopinata Kibby_2008]|nr:hypothetical protein AX17_003208 [Amanita inopinata Kibby_2008]